MVDLDRFDLDGITMWLNRLETQGQQLIFSGYAQIERIPASHST
jgi:predicted deacetylase